MKKRLMALSVAAVMGLSLIAADGGQEKSVPEVSWDKYSLIIDGKRQAAVMGEVHYSRIPEDEWAYEVRKMKEGGITLIATYVFWNHIEETEGIFRWDGQRNLRRFLEVCRDADIENKVTEYLSHGVKQNDWAGKPLEYLEAAMQRQASYEALQLFLINVASRIAKLLNK